jgi:hypothetical protein
MALPYSWCLDSFLPKSEVLVFRFYSNQIWLIVPEYRRNITFGYKIPLIRLFIQIRQFFRRWWGDSTLQTRLMAGATLVVSLITSALTFWAVHTIQSDARLNDTRFARDLGLLLAANVAPLVSQGDRAELARFSSSFYQSTTSVRYMLYADEEGKSFLVFPSQRPP